jgi:hypothetical protein
MFGPAVCVNDMLWGVILTLPVGALVVNRAPKLLVKLQFEVILVVPQNLLYTGKGSFHCSSKPSQSVSAVRTRTHANVYGSKSY